MFTGKLSVNSIVLVLVKLCDRAYHPVTPFVYSNSARVSNLQSVKTQRCTLPVLPSHFNLKKLKPSISLYSRTFSLIICYLFLMYNRSNPASWISLCHIPIYFQVALRLMIMRLILNVVLTNSNRHTIDGACTVLVDK